MFIISKNFYSIFSAEVLVTGVARLTLGAGRANLVHRLASIVTSYGVVTDSQGLVGQEWPHLFRVVAEATADLVSVSPDNLGVVASVMGKPRVTLSIIIGPQPTSRSHTKGLMLPLLKPGEMTSLYQPSEASLATSFIS